MDNVVIMTAIYGHYDSVKPAPLCGVPALLYTDSLAVADDAHDKGWTPFVLPHSVVTLNGEPAVTNPMLNHKYVKCLPHLFTEATISIWIDGSMEVVEPRFVELSLEALGDDDWAIMPHPERRCIYPEADVSAGLARYHAPSIKAQAAHYSAFHPANWGLFATGFMVRRHTATVAKVGQHWWEENLLWSHQDQLSLPVLFRLFEGQLAWNIRLPWHKWWLLHFHG